MNDIPVSIGAIDAAWMSQALRAAGHDHPGINHITAKPMPGIVGALGEVGVVEVDYAGPAPCRTRMWPSACSTLISHASTTRS